jgi:hypothetical protein
MKVSHLVILPKKESTDGLVRISSRLHLPGKNSHEFFFEIPSEIFDSRMESHANHHLLAMLMPAMRVGGKLRIEGAVDPVLLKNLDPYLHYWRRWCPERLKMLEVEAAEILPAPRAVDPAMISCFSGGADSIYSYLRAEVDYGVPLKTLMFLHGFDIDLNRHAYYQKIAEQYQEWLRARSSKATLISLVTNARETSEKFQLNWGSMAHGIHLAACMHLFSHQHTLGCIPSSDTPSTLIYPWGSTPVTDPLLSTSALSMRHHDCMVSKFGKLLELVKHSDCCRVLRVCYQHETQNPNCGRCGKCLRSLVAMHLAAEDSWREAFPSVKSFDEVMEKVRKIRWDKWMIEQLDDVRDHAWRNRDSSIARQIDALIEKKHREARPAQTSLRRLFYDVKVRLYARYPALIKKS